MHQLSRSNRDRQRRVSKAQWGQMSLPVAPSTWKRNETQHIHGDRGGGGGWRAACGRAAAPWLTVVRFKPLTARLPSLRERNGGRDLNFLEFANVDGEKPRVTDRFFLSPQQAAPPPQRTSGTLLRWGCGKTPCMTVHLTALNGHQAPHHRYCGV